MTDVQQAVPVAQIDRDFAAYWTVIAPQNAKKIRAGEWDHHEGVQAAARHRLTEPARKADRLGEGDIGEANHDCLAKRRPGEPMFILLGRDPDAWQIVQAWADRRLAAGGDPHHVALGLKTANAMRDYAADPANHPASAPDASAYPPIDPTHTREAELRSAIVRDLIAERRSYKEDSPTWRAFGFCIDIAEKALFAGSAQ
jgi:hypothetical protein